MADSLVTNLANVGLPKWRAGRPARFRSAGALASYVGAVQRLKQSGNRANLRNTNSNSSQRTLAAPIEDADIGRSSNKSLAANSLSKTMLRRKTPEVGTRGLRAKTTRRSLQRCSKPAAVRAEVDERTYLRCLLNPDKWPRA